MIRFCISAVALGLAASAIAPASAAPAPAKPAKIKLDTLKPGKVKVDPRLGYILVRMGPRATSKDNPLPIGFMRVSPETQLPFAEDDPETKAPNYSQTLGVGVNTARSFGDSDGAGVYLVAAYPGRWIISGVGNTCLSMGTYAFDVKQGEISDIGLMLTGREDGNSIAPEIRAAKLSDDLVEFGTLVNVVMTSALFARPASDDPAVPPELSAMPRSHVKLTPDVMLPNLCMDMVGRAASLPPLGHRPPMTEEEAAKAIDEINPDELAERVAKARAAKAAANKKY